MTDYRLSLPDLNEEHERAKSKKYIEEAMLAHWQANRPKRTPAYVHTARTYWRMLCRFITGFLLVSCVLCFRSFALLDGALTFGLSLIPASLCDICPGWFVHTVRLLDGEEE